MDIWTKCSALHDCTKARQNDMRDPNGGCNMQLGFSEENAETRHGSMRQSHTLLFQLCPSVFAKLSAARSTSSGKQFSRKTNKNTTINA